VQAVLDLVSNDRDPLLLYDDNQFLYPDYRRIPATRFQQRYFLIGSIYLGQTSPKYVLKDTWKWFEQDLRQSDPAAFIETGDIDSKEFAEYVDDHFEPAFDGQAGRVHLRDDVAEAVLRGPTDRAWTPPDQPNNGPGWTVATGTARYAQSSTAAAEDRLVLATQQCQRVDGALDTPNLVVHIEDWTGARPETRFVVNGTTVSTEDGGGTVETVSVPEPDTDGAPADAESSFGLVLGKRSGVLVLNGRIVGAVPLPERTKVTIEPTTPALAMTEMRVGAPPPDSGCD
jgi:hypothetical protein